MNNGSYELRFYDRTGSHIHNVGGEGGGPGNFYFPRDLFSLGTDSLFVWDPRQKRITVFDPSGEYIRDFTFPGPENRHSPGGMFSNGMIVAHEFPLATGRVTTGLKRSQIRFATFSSTGQFNRDLGLFDDIDEVTGATDDGVIFGVKAIWGRFSVRTVSHNSFFIGTNDSYVINQYNKFGEHIRSIRRPVEIPVSDAVFQSEVDRLTSPNAPDFLSVARRQMRKPEIFPSYSEFHPDPDGNLWVLNYSPRSMPSCIWTVFDREGRMLGDVEMPEGLRVFEIGLDYVLGSWKNEDGVEFVQLHSLIH